MRKSILSLSAICILCLPSSAKTKHAPLPEQVLQAKTVCIDNQTKSASLNDKLYDELSKWGRFRIVQRPDEADLVFVLSASSYVTGFHTHSNGNTTGTVDDDGNVQLSNNGRSHSRATTATSIYLTVTDPKTARSLWSDSKSVHSLVKELHKRIDEQEADGKGKGK